MGNEKKKGDLRSGKNHGPRKTFGKTAKNFTPLKESRRWEKGGEAVLLGKRALLSVKLPEGRG